MRCGLFGSGCGPDLASSCSSHPLRAFIWPAVASTTRDERAVVTGSCRQLAAGVYLLFRPHTRRAGWTECWALASLLHAASGG